MQGFIQIVLPSVTWLNFPARDKTPGKEMLREYNTFICLKSNKL